MPRLPLERSYYNPVVERMSREELQGLQGRRLKLLLEYLYYRSPFYRRRFQEAKIAPEDMETMEDFQARVPLSGKADFIKDQEGNPPYGQRLAVSPQKVIRLHFTSGTSGKGQEVMGVTPFDRELEYVWARGIVWAGVKRGEVVASLAPTSLGPMSGTDSLAEGLDHIGVNAIYLGITYSTEQKVQLLKRFSPHFIHRINLRVVYACKEAGIDPRRDLPRLKGLTASYSEGISVEYYQAMEDFWDAPCHAYYGCTEAKSSTGHTCEGGLVPQGGWGIIHFFEDVYLFEVLDRETRHPVGPGEEGELVLTTLTAEASPVLRFATNDRVMYLPHSYCSCGRPFAGIRAGFVHRYDDMIKIRGMNVWPVAVDTVTFGHPEVAEYGGRVWLSPDGHEEVTLRLEFKPDVPLEKRRQLLATLPRELKDTIGIRMTVEEVPSLPRFEWKARRWRDERGITAPAVAR